MENNTQNKKEAPHQKNYGCFIENFQYSATSPLIVVRGLIEGEQKTIGMVYQWFDTATEKYVCRATDKEGNPLFEDEDNLFALKKNFKELAKSLAMEATEQKQVGELNVNGKRKAELSKIRTQETGNELDPEIEY